MGMIETKSFKSGNSVAVRLPAELGVPAGVTMAIERIGAELRIILRDDEAERLARFRAMLDEFEALGPVSTERPLTREDVRVELPERSGLS